MSPGQNYDLSSLISVLQYSNDAVFPSLAINGLQRNLNVFSETYLHYGLIVNAAKTEVLSASSSSSTDDPTLSVSGKQLRIRKLHLLGLKSLIFWKPDK